MTNRVGDLCDISTGPNPLFPPSETANSEADDRPEDEEEPISEAEPSSDEDEDDVEEIEEPVPLQVESVAHRLVNCFSLPHSVDRIVCLFGVKNQYGNIGIFVPQIPELAIDAEALHQRINLT